MPLALFDLDNTLIAGDSDYEWGRFLVSIGKVDADLYQRTNEVFYRDYQRGQLDIQAYLRFALAPLAAMEPSELAAIHQRFMADIIRPLWLSKAEALIAQHREQGDQLVIITATNRFVVEPICAALGVSDIIATEPEILNGRYTGAVVGEPSFKEGKVIRLQQWLAERGFGAQPGEDGKTGALIGEGLEGSFFYSDSGNDLPLLMIVDNPVAVDPDDELCREAEARGWPVISLRESV